MTKQSICLERRRQRSHSQQGDALFEALIGFMLLMVLGLGLSYAAARALNSQRYASTQNIALNQMRGFLQSDAADGGVRNLCGGATPNISIEGGEKLTIPVTTSNCAKNDVTVGVTGNANLNVTLIGSTANSVYTRMNFGTAVDNDNARKLLGDSSTVLSQ